MLFSFQHSNIFNKVFYKCLIVNEKHFSAFNLAKDELIINCLKDFTFDKITIMSLNISEILNHLHINDNNDAFSTGSKWGGSAGGTSEDHCFAC